MQLAIGFSCPLCQHHEAEVEYRRNEDGNVVALLLRCLSCGWHWKENV